MIMRWLKRLFGTTSEDSKVGSLAQEDDRLPRFEAFLAARLQQLRPDVLKVFQELFAARTGEDTKSVNIEVFDDAAPFSFRMFEVDPDNIWCSSPEYIQAANRVFDAMVPIMSELEMDPFWIWEEDPKWGRQVALEQPLDALDVPGILMPWFRGLVSEARGASCLVVTASVHDLTMPQEL